MKKNNKSKVQPQTKQTTKQIQEKIINFNCKQNNPDSFCTVIIGMSGTGKTTLVNSVAEKEQNIMIINLDPAVKHIKYTPILDIRQTHHYQKIMKDYQLGPNGAILTALNLFLTTPQKILEIVINNLLKHKGKKIHLMIDIPGQIQVFTWSSSSLILTAALNAILPVKIVYILDGGRCQNPNSLLSNILFAQSIQHRFSTYPFMVLINKSDASDTNKISKWINDEDSFMEALRQDSSYISTLSYSIVLHLSDFYKQICFIACSAKTYQNIPHVLTKINELQIQKKKQKNIQNIQNTQTEDIQKNIKQNLKNQKI